MMHNSKNLITPQCEKLRCDLIEVATGAGSPWMYSIVEDTPAIPQTKLHSGLWDTLAGFFRGINAPAGSERLKNEKLKVIKDPLPALKEKFEDRAKKLVNLLLLFIMAKNALDERAKMFYD